MESWTIGAITDELRHGLAEGRFRGRRLLAFDGLPPLDPELLVRCVLADVDHYDDLAPDYRRRPDVVARRLKLLDDVRQLAAALLK